MIDESQETLNEVDQTSEDTSSSEAQEETQDLDQGQEQNQEQESAAEPTQQEKKPTRAERRVQQLLEKMKAQKSGADTSQFDASQQNEDLISPDEYESGIDPKVLEQRAKAREQRNLQQSTQAIKQQLKAEFAYEQATKDHEADLESVSQSEEIKKNPALERMAVRLYEKENYLVDPRTGQTYFNPVIKLSEALKIVSQDLAEATGISMADARVKANENRETGALTPSQDASSSDSDYSQALENAKNKGDDHSWAEVLKKRGMVNVS